MKEVQFQKMFLAWLFSFGWCKNKITFLILILLCLFFGRKSGDKPGGAPADNQDIGVHYRMIPRFSIIFFVVKRVRRCNALLQAV